MKKLLTNLHSDASIQEIPIGVYSDRLSYVLATNQLEKDIEKSKMLLDQSSERVIGLRTELEEENRRLSELTTLRTFMQAKTGEVQSQSTQQATKIINDLLTKKEAVDGACGQRLGDLKTILDNYVPQVLAPKNKGKDEDEDEDEKVGRKKMGLELRQTIESLLNEMIDSENAENYVRVNDLNSPIVKFLLLGDLVTTKPDDARYIKLRAFGKPSRLI
jgi:hypothetical protein